MMNIDELAMQVFHDTGFDINTPLYYYDLPQFACALIAEYEAAGSKPVEKRFNCWSTNEGDSWYEHPADAQLLEDVLGNEPKVGDEFEVMAGWHCVQAKYKIVSQDGDDFEVECLSHPFDTSPSRPDPRVAELEAQVNAARALSPPAELLEARDRKRDAKLLRHLKLHLYDATFHHRIAKCIDLKELASKRESGEWKPELGD